LKLEAVQNQGCPQCHIRIAIQIYKRSGAVDWNNYFVVVERAKYVAGKEGKLAAGAKDLPVVVDIRAFE
jgi:hypothetical protein